MKTIVRDFSVVGPCITLGEFIKRTPTMIVYRDRRGETKRVGGWRVEKDMVHTEPCPSCRDHARTQYAEGYMD